MKRKHFYLLMVCLLAGNARGRIIWPEAKTAAIVLTYDDGLASQREYVMPQLEEAGFRGTFFLYGQVVRTEDIPAWREAAARGHELGNHSLFHPCLTGTTDPDSSPCHSLECYSVKDMLIEIKMMNSFLFAIDGKSEHAYAYPCGQRVVGNGEDYSKPLLLDGVVRYARGAARGIVADAGTLDFSMVPTLPALPGCGADELIAYVKEVLACGGLGVIVFHGVGGDYLTVDKEEHRKLVAFLKDHKQDIWVGTFSEVMNYLAARAAQP